MAQAAVMKAVAEDDTASTPTDADDLSPVEATNGHAYAVPPLDVGDCKTDDKRKRRNSVSAESKDPRKLDETVKQRVYPKSDTALARIRASMAGIFLFNGLDREQRTMLVNAMFEKRVAAGEDIITQGDEGDFFYVVERGHFEVWKSPDLKRAVAPSKVFEYRDSGSFGELALMYRAKRAATVRAVTDGVLWAVDGETFRHLILQSTAKKRARFYDFLKTVPLFNNVSEELRSQIADVLEVFQFNEGDYVIRKGEPGRHFYIIQHGKADVVLRKKVVKTLREGHYFGERALLLNTERSADIVASSRVLRVVGMDKASFFRLMESTHAYQKLRRHMRYYVIEEINTLSGDDDDDY